MRTLTLIRTIDTGHATFGQLVGEDGTVLCCTLELAWRNNEHGRSCIPPGTYPARRRASPKHHGVVFGVEDVPGRSDIEIHIGNFADSAIGGNTDTEGCILLGTETHDFSGQLGVSGSERAFTAFMALLAGEDAFTLDVRAAPESAT